MRRREIYWSFYRISDKKQIDDLRTDQCEVIFEILTDDQRQTWLIWREGFPSWKPFAEFPQLLLGLRQTESHQPHPAPPLEDASEPKTSQPSTSAEAAPQEGAARTSVSQRLARFAAEAGSGVSLALDAEDNGEDRDGVRFERRFEVRILTKEKTFLNSTMNISLKGMMLKDSLPNHLPALFSVELNLGERVIPMICSVVKSPDGSPSYRLKIEANENPTLLRSVLLAG